MVRNEKQYSFLYRFLEKWIAYQDTKWVIGQVRGNGLTPARLKI
jgi:hypothetical protein